MTLLLQLCSTLNEGSPLCSWRHLPPAAAAAVPMHKAPSHAVHWSDATRCPREGKGEAPCRFTKHLLTHDLVPCHSTCYYHMLLSCPRRTKRHYGDSPSAQNPNSFLPQPHANLPISTCLTDQHNYVCPFIMHDRTLHGCNPSVYFRPLI